MATKRAADSSSDVVPYSRSKMESSGNSSGEGGGGPTDVIVGPLIDRPITVDYTTLTFDHEYTFTFVNPSYGVITPGLSNNSTLWQWYYNGSTPTTATKFGCRPGLFEIPYNHLGFYLDGHEAGIVDNFNAYRLKHASFEIMQAEAVTFQFQDATPTARFTPSSNVAPGIQICRNYYREPPQRTRNYVYDYYGIADDITTPDNSSSTVNVMTNQASQYMAALPVVCWGTTVTAGTQAANQLSSAPMRRDRIMEQFNHGCPPIKHEANLISGWRRGYEVPYNPTVNRVTSIDKYGPSNDQTNLIAHVAIPGLPPLTDFVGRCNTDTDWSYRHDMGQKDEDYKTDINYGFYITSDYQTGMNVGDGAGNDVGSALVMKYKIKVCSKVVIDCKYGSDFSNAGQGRNDHSDMMHCGVTSDYAPLDPAFI